MHVLPLLETLSLARSRQGFCAPNPAVGAVLVRQGTLVARGAHHGPGHPRAEVECLKNVSDSELIGATLYVSLEPCCHLGKRTPPCAQMLIARKVEHVVYAYADPNPEVAGRGAALLRAAGIECTHASLPEIDAFYAPYRHWTLTRRPFVTAKLAITLDGKIALAGGKPYAITGNDLLTATHRARQESDAILTSARTIQADNPQLNSRLDPQSPIGKPVYVLDARAETPTNARVFTSASSVTFFVAETNEASENLAAAGGKIVMVPKTRGQLDLDCVLAHIGNDGRISLWVEAGGKLFAHFHERHLLQRALVYVAPKWLGESAQSAFPGGVDDLFAKAETIDWRGEGRDAVCEVRF